MIRRGNDEAVTRQMGAQERRLASVAQARVRVENQRIRAGLDRRVAHRCLPHRRGGSQHPTMGLGGWREVHPAVARAGSSTHLPWESTIARPGKLAKFRCYCIWVCDSWSIRPHDRNGGGGPTPRNDSVDVSSTTSPMRSEALTMITGSKFGKMCSRTKALAVMPILLR